MLKYRIKSRRIRWVACGKKEEEECLEDIGGKSRKKGTTGKIKTYVGGQY
jgi:hypothetical protein